MTRGIQLGTIAWDKESLAIHKQVKYIADEIKLEYPQFSTVTKFTKKHIPNLVCGFQPDGYGWYYQNKLVLVIEAKKQGNIGNAIERWYKNYFIATKINPEVTYLTFACGSGSAKGEIIWKILHMPHDGQFNIIRKNKPTAFLSSKGFTNKFIKETICSILNLYLCGQVEKQN